MEAIKVLIADDHPLIRQGLAMVLGLEPKIKVAGEAGDGEEAYNQAKELNPDVVLMDLNMPRVDGIEAAKRIRVDFPHIRIIALTVHEDDDKVFEVFQAGVNGYILKDVSPDRLIEAVKAVHAGETIIHPVISTKLFKELNRVTAESSQQKKDILEEPLTAREQEVLKLIAQGISNQHIAKQLFISEKTVKNHITNIFRKIKVCDRTQAALYAIKTKLIEVS